jgi:DNA-binding protein HU-beta
MKDSLYWSSESFPSWLRHLKQGRSSLDFSLTLPGLAGSRPRTARARQGRNPATGETIEIAALEKLGFSPAKQVKNALKG